MGLVILGADLHLRRIVPVLSARFVRKFLQDNQPGGMADCGSYAQPASSPAAAARGGRDRPGRGPAFRRGGRAGRGARAGRLRLGCRGRGGPPAGRGAAGPAGGRVAGPGGGGVRGGPGHYLAVGPGGGLGRGGRAGPGAARPEGREEADARPAGPGCRAGRCRADAAADRRGDRGFDVHRPGRAGPGPAGRPGSGRPGGEAGQGSGQPARTPAPGCRAPVSRMAATSTARKIRNSRSSTSSSIQAITSPRLFPRLLMHPAKQRRGHLAAAPARSPGAGPSHLEPGHLVNATAASAAEANNCRRADSAVVHPRCCHSRSASESPAITTSPNGMER